MSTPVDDGQALGDYEILDVAGTGGMGVVYRANQRSLSRTVALKVIRDEIARTSEFRERFLREARVAASVDHPHVVSVYGVGEQDGHLFLAMQWVEGYDLKRLLARTGRIAPDRAILITTQLAGALDAVHGVAGLVHRDVKPANVLLRQVGGNDHAYLTDFGVAKASGRSEQQLTQTGSVVGTAGYLAPEQIRGEDPSSQSDLYALACVLFEMLTGQQPFRADNEMALRWAHANDSRPLVSDVVPALGTRYDGFMATALAADPEHRFMSGRALANALVAAHDAQRDFPTRTRQPARASTAIGPPAPRPSRTTPQPQPSVAEAHGYITPQPPHPPRARSGSPFALILLGVVALSGITVGVLAATGAFSTKAVQAPAQTGRPQPGARPQTASGGTRSCGGDISANVHASCPFARAIEQAYIHSAGGDTTVSAYSSVLRRTYPVHCTGTVPHECTGGEQAVVYFAAGPSP